MKKHAAVNGELRWDLRQHSERQAPKNARPVLESGTAYKTVYLSKAPPHFGHEKLTEALDQHVNKMRDELQRDGKMVTNVTKTLFGKEGDVRVVMNWVILGVKNTKRSRKRGPTAATTKPNEPGRPAAQEGLPEGGLPL